MESVAVFLGTAYGVDMIGSGRRSRQFPTRRDTTWIRPRGQALQGINIYPGRQKGNYAGSPRNAGKVSEWLA
jgi:hypothetical protein